MKRRRDDAKLKMTMEIRGTTRNTHSHLVQHPHLHLHHTRGKGKSARGQATGAQCVRECFGGAATRPASQEIASEVQACAVRRDFVTRMSRSTGGKCGRSAVRRGNLVLWAGCWLGSGSGGYLRDQAQSLISISRFSQDDAKQNQRPPMYTPPWPGSRDMRFV